MMSMEVNDYVKRSQQRSRRSAAISLIYKFDSFIMIVIHLRKEDYDENRYHNCRTSDYCRVFCIYLKKS